MSAPQSFISYQPGVLIEDLELIIEKTPRNVWDTLRGKKIFITGGTGFVGCWMLEALIWANQQLELNLTISVLSRNPQAFFVKAPHLASHKIITLIQGDVTELTKILQMFDVVIHAATDVVNPESNPIDVYSSIVDGTKATLDLAIRSKAKHYLLTSSGAVYGGQPASLTHIPETYMGAPATTAVNSAYGQAKRISEWLCHSYARQYELDVQVARCFALIGPYLPLDAQFAVGNFIKDGLDKKNISVSGDGTAYRSYLYAADMIVWLLAILVNGEHGEQYNLGSDNEITIKDLAENVSEIIYGENKVVIGSDRPVNKIINRYVPDVSKTRQSLGVDQYNDLKTSIIKTINWEIRRRELSRQHIG